MAEESNLTRSEAPTPRRRETARQKGQVAFSADLQSGCVVLIAGIFFWLAGETLGQTLLTLVRGEIRGVYHPEWNEAQSVQLAGISARQFGWLLAPFAAITITTGLGVALAQAGVRITPESLNPDWERLSLSKGWSRIFSMNSVVRGSSSVIKLCGIGLIMWWIVTAQPLGNLPNRSRSLEDVISRGWSITVQMWIAVGCLLLAIGALDYLFQWWRNEQRLRMTRQELKDERKEEEGDPLMRARIKKLQRERATRQMIDDVARSTVVLTNPTHIAVALDYQRGTAGAPKVVAKGQGAMAKRIVEMAQRSHVPILERKPLARALYKTVQVGQEIPASLYKAIAEILAYVYQLRRGVG